uniref:Putative secreted protein n=1 Tax=Ixodes ricinus TaxID=34613 RepID=V5HAL3_IXORI
MQLVFFAVMLILPSFLSGESHSSITEVSDECGLYIVEGGNSACEKKSSYYQSYDSETCTVTCQNGEELGLPEGVCSGGKVDCTPEVNKTLHKWLSIIEQ